MKHKILALSLAVLCGMLAAGCQKDDALDLSKYKTIITVKSNDAKTHYNPAEHSVEWDAGDHIGVVRGNSGSENPFADFELVDVQEGVARFGSQSALAANGNYHAVYPAQEGLSIHEGVLSCTAVRHDQSLAEGSFGHGDNTAVGYDASTTMQFRNVGGLAKIALRGNVKIKSIKIASNGDDTLSGRGTIDLYDSNLKIRWEPDAAPVATRNEVVATTVLQNSGVSVSGGRIFYIVLPPCTLNSYTITVTDVFGNQHHKDFTTPVTITRTTVTSLGAFDVSSIDVAPGRQFRYTSSDGLAICSDADWAAKFPTFISDIYDEGTSWHIVTFSEALTSIPARCFSGKNTVTAITLPDGVTSIGEYAFYGCSSLTSVNIPSGVTSIGNDAFNGCSRLASVTLPDCVTGIGNYAFDGCTSLSTINIPTSLTSIGQYAFSSCSSLTGSICIPDGVTSIKECVFYGCSSITRFAIPGNVSEIKRSAFDRCTSITDVFYNGTGAPSFGERVFGVVPNTATLHLDQVSTQTAWDAWDAAWPGGITPSRPDSR